MVQSIHPASSKGRLISVMRRGAGCGGRCGRQDVARAAEAQAAMIRLTGRGSPAEDIKKVRPAMPVNGVCPPGLSQSKPINTARGTPTFSAVRGDCNLMRFPHTAHGAMGLAESPAFRAPLRSARVGMRVGTPGAPAPAKEQGRRSLVRGIQSLALARPSPHSPAPLERG
jgi:hypothetical protein